MEHLKNKNCDVSEDGKFLHSREFLRIPWLFHVTTTRHFNAGSEQRKDDLLRLSHQWKLHTQLIVHARQTHSSEIRVIRNHQDSSTDILRLNNVDGFITQEPGTLLCVFTADCIPMMAVAREKEIVGMAHCGWRGILGGIVEEMVNGFLELGAKLPELQVWLGPGIQGSCYEVGEQVIADFQRVLPTRTNFAQGRLLNLYRVIEIKLAEKGLTPQQMKMCALCTHCSPELLFSYRREGKNCGSLISAIMIKD